MIDVCKIISLLDYCGPLTYDDLLYHGLQGEEIELMRLVNKGILIKDENYYDLPIET